MYSPFKPRNAATNQDSEYKYHVSLQLSKLNISFLSLSLAEAIIYLFLVSDSYNQFIMIIH